LRSDEYVNLPECLDGVDIPGGQLNTVIHEVMHMVLEIPVTEEAKVVAISEVIQPRTRRHKYFETRSHTAMFAILRKRAG